MTIKMEQHPTQQTPDYKKRKKDTENPTGKRLSYLIYALDTQTSPTHIYSNKNNPHGMWDVILHIHLNTYW